MRGDRGFRCLGHLSIMPRHGPAINQRRARVGGTSSFAGSPDALITEHPGEFQDDDDDQGQPGDYRHPRRRLVEPLGVRRRSQNRRRRGGRRRGRRLGGLTHTSHNASGQWRPRLVRYRGGVPKIESPAPPGDAGLVESWGYGSAGANDGETDSGVCDGPGPPNPWWNSPWPWWNPAPWPWCCGPPCIIEWWCHPW